MLLKISKRRSGMCLVTKCFDSDTTNALMTANVKEEKTIFYNICQTIFRIPCVKDHLQEFRNVVYWNGAKTIFFFITSKNIIITMLTTKYQQAK